MVLYLIPHATPETRVVSARVREPAKQRSFQLAARRFLIGQVVSLFTDLFFLCVCVRHILIAPAPGQRRSVARRRTGDDTASLVVLQVEVVEAAAPRPLAGARDCHQGDG
jgi:hypothetical protein